MGFCTHIASFYQPPSVKVFYETYTAVNLLRNLRDLPLEYKLHLLISSNGFASDTALLIFVGTVVAHTIHSQCSSFHPLGLSAQKSLFVFIIRCPLVLNLIKGEENAAALKEACEQVRLNKLTGPELTALYAKHKVRRAQVSIE